MDNLTITFKDFVFLNNTFILHKNGYILNLNTLYLLYPKINQPFKFQKKEINFKELMINKFYNLYINNNNIQYKDNNPLNNDLNNLIIKTKLHTLNNIIQINYIILIYQYTYDNKLLKVYNNIKHITLNKDNKIFVLNLLMNKFVLFKDYKWKLEIKKITFNNIYQNYSNIIDKYYISNDYTHIINIHNLEILYIYSNKKLNNYVKLKLNKKIIEFKLEFYDNPEYYITYLYDNFNLFNYEQINLDNDLMDNFIKNYDIITDFKTCGIPNIN